MAELKQSEKDDLELLVDRRDMAWVLDALSDIAYNKAAHIQMNWQDAGLARLWEQVGALVGTCAGRVQKKRLP